MNLCKISDCQTKQHTRGLCNTHYVYHRNHGTLDEVALPKAYKHYLSDVNPAERTAICAICGPTRVGTNGIDRYGRTAFDCQTKKDEKNRKRAVYTFGDGDTIPYDEATAARTRLHKEQNGLCAICNRPEAETGTLRLDHCHDTGKIRGLLCNGCNMGIGSFKDSPENLIAASEYLTR